MSANKHFCSDCSYVRKNNDKHAFCRTCFLERKDDILETIELVDGKMCYNTFSSYQQAEAERKLSTLSASVRYDLHGVLDTVAVDVMLSNVDSCLISYVGATGRIRLLARKEAINRIKNGQIKFGLLVFKRGRHDNRNRFTYPGSKAWANQHLSNVGKILFIDDGYDHVSSVNSLKLSNLKCVLKTNDTKLQEILDDFIKMM